MLRAERPAWERYVEGRIETYYTQEDGTMVASGWSAYGVIDRLRRLPRTTPQGHRWFLLKTHLRGHATSHRVHNVRSSVTVAPCVFCGRQQGDQWSHMAGACNVVADARPLVQAEGFTPGRLPDLFMQRELDGGTVSLTLAYHVALWQARTIALRGVQTTNAADLAALITRHIDCPWIADAGPAADRKARRKLRARPPPPVSDGDWVFRSDGACRQPGGVAGWGAANWGAGARGQGPPHRTAEGYIGAGSTNNIAEYRGVLECFRLAVATIPSGGNAVFEVDSMLVALHLRGKWACRDPGLGAYYSECLALGHHLTATARSWEIRHVYREYNAVADALANAGIDSGASVDHGRVVWRVWQT